MNVAIIPQMMLTPDQYLSALSSDGEALAASAQRNLGASVPSCPGWTTADLVRHTGVVHRHKAEAIRCGGTAYPKDLAWVPAPAGAEALFAWYREGLADLLDVLDAPPDQAAWSWAGDHRVAFWQRRMAQETLVHRWDAQAAVGQTTPLSAELAADGVDEYLDVWLPRAEQRDDTPSGTVHVHATDADGEWLVRLDEGTVVLTRAHARGDVALRGRAEDLLLVLWRRRPLDAVEVLGDRTLAEDLLAWPDL